MAVPMVDLSRTPDGLDAAVREAVLRVLGHRRFILGPEVERFEQALAPLFSGRRVVGVSSGTDALMAALMALDVRPGDEVVTTPFSFFATAGVVVRLGARPVMVDVEPRTYCLDAEKLGDLDPTRVRAVVPVHLFGHVMDLDPVLDWAGEVPVVEDAAQAIGAQDARGRRAGTRGCLAAVSFFPTKNLGALGDAGAVVAGDPDLAGRVHRLRAHGQSGRYHHDEVGGNFRLDALQAAALAAALPWLAELNATRCANAEGYQRRLEAAGLAGRVIPPPLEAGRTFHQYVVRIPGEGRRDRVREHLQARNVGTAVYYPVPLHLQPCFRSLGYRPGDFPEAERAAREVLALPVFPGLRPAEQDEVVEALAEALDRA